MNYDQSQLMRACACFMLLISSCLRASTYPATSGGGDLESYMAQGEVKKIATDHHQVTVHHQAIPGYMMEMTMDFPVKNAGELQGISVGDKITFVLDVNQKTEWIENIRKVGHVTGVASTVMAMPCGSPGKLTAGDELPDGDFVTEDGRTMHFSDFRGKVVAFTFFFTRCPLPEYCPLMNRNFYQTRELLLSSTSTPGNWQLLSLSFDGDFDHPEVLTAYAKTYRGDSFEHWLFATASTKTLAEVGVPLGLMMMHEGAGIAHNLRTVVLDANGAIFHQFDDNQWTPKQLASVMREAMHSSQTKGTAE
jgi:protein SCO1/2